MYDEPTRLDGDPILHQRLLGGALSNLAVGSVLTSVTRTDKAVGRGIHLAPAMHATRGQRSILLGSCWLYVQWKLALTTVYQHTSNWYFGAWDGDLIADER